MKFLLGTKLDMTQVWDESGKVVPVTRIQAGPCTVTQVKTEEADGYSAVQVGFGHKKRVTKALKGHLGGKKFRYLREFRGDVGDLKKGDVSTVADFEAGQEVTLRGVSKGKGFQGVVKRHGFKGSPASHGHKDQLRMPGSIGATEPARVFKGTRMAGRMGGEQTTVQKVHVVSVDKDTNILTIRGAVPGARNGLVEISA